MGETDQPETCCSGTCADLTGDSSNCGTCGTVCSQPNPFCAQSTCQCYVSINSCLCAGYCYDLITESCPGCVDNFPNEDSCPSNSCN
jgi:hypothetical protein